MYLCKNYLISLFYEIEMIVNIGEQNSWFQKDSQKSWIKGIQQGIELFEPVSFGYLR